VVVIGLTIKSFFKKIKIIQEVSDFLDLLGIAAEADGMGKPKKKLDRRIFFCLHLSEYSSISLSVKI